MTTKLSKTELTLEQFAKNTENARSVLKKVRKVLTESGLNALCVVTDENGGHHFSVTPDDTEAHLKLAAVLLCDARSGIEDCALLHRIYAAQASVSACLQLFADAE